MNNKQQKDLFEINSIDSVLTQEAANLISGVGTLTTNTYKATLSPPITTIHNDYIQSFDELLILSGDTAQIEVDFTARFPLFFAEQFTRYIPNKVKTNIERYCNQTKLSKIHPDKEVSVELCLIIISNLSGAYYDEHSAGWQRLMAEFMQESVSDQFDNTYKKIIDLLEEGTKKEGIIEYSKQFTIGQESRRYRLTKTYRNKGVKKYEFQTQHCRNLLSKVYFKKLKQAMDNPIANNLISLYQKINLPNVEEVKAQGKKLCKEGYITKKGKVLTMQNKHKKDYWVDSDNRSFVENDIELFKRLTQHGYLIPSVGDANNGGRVVDSFTLMPAWIRNMIKVDGKSIEECDLTALHPNIAMSIYGGDMKYITHKQVADAIGIDLIDAKKEHLSFFNKPWTTLYHSPLFNYYKDTQPKMMENMYHDKAAKGYKVTSRRMATKEVEIMTEVIQTLNKEGMVVGYIYDALFCTPKQKERVIEVMNEVVLKHKVYTTAK